jgi:tetratricopeptide (TPR) repeat protein
MLKFIILLLLCTSVLAQGTLTSKEGQLLKSEGLRLWHKRDVKDSLEEALSKFDLAHQADPSDIETIHYLVRGYFILADAHTSDKEDKKRFLEKAKDLGLKGLMTNSDFKNLIEKEKEDVEDAVKVLTLREVEVAFWTAGALGLYSKTNGIFSSIKYKDQIVSLLKRVESLKPDFFHGAVPRFWGSYYAVIPGIAGRDIKKSKKYFEESIAMAPEFLATKVLMAEIYAVETDDKKLFKKLLLEVIADQNTYQDLLPENAIERKKAERLLEEEDKLF